MGIHDRDYYRPPSGRLNPLRAVTSTAVGTIAAITVLCWFAQLLGGDAVTGFLAATARDVFGLHIYKLLTANFAHDPNGVWHIVWNMLFLFFFGRELEAIYGPRDFLAFYLAAGAVAVLAEVISLSLTGAPGVRVLGASGAVMAIVVVFTLFFPHRQILFIFIPMPVWLLCILYIAQDVLGLLRPNAGIANLAHLTGAVFGLAYWHFGLRWSRLEQGIRGWLRRRRADPKILQFPRARREPKTPEDAQVSQRIDRLLAKIHEEGRDSLSEDEWQFLKENSGRYRSD